MYLKEIKVSGFKSFADKMDINFQQGMTGIVGPNGSGKSNIVDAVRWVLGEQSVKSLRGDGSMTDVIFSGSKTRNPASSASVTLIFDNSNHYFPVDYHEVAIKRVVYRTGENEYFLNSAKCRLKDVTNLVLDTGVGREAFNIISQGNIQEILSNKPEDRRIVFEEAAGVLKYKKRKEEALRKLEKTHDNLNRVDDIINELEGQIDPLKEQSEKAQIYLNTKKELEQIEIALIVHDVENLNEEYQNNKAQVDALNEESIKLTNENSTFQADLEKNKLDYTRENEELYKLQQHLIELSSTAEKLNGQKNLITERQKYNSDDVKVHDQLVIKKEQQLKLQSDVHNIEKDKELKQLELDELAKNINQLELKMETLKNGKSSFNKQLEEKSRHQLELKHHINLLEQSIENNSGLPYALKSILNNPKLKGIHNVIGKLIEVDQPYAISIDIALGASASFVVVDSDKTAKEAINYLKTNNAGRATFFPLDIIKGRTLELEVYEQIKNHSAFVDIASNLINYDSSYKNIMLNQLGNVIVAKDIDGANELGKLIKYKYKIVTLDGELLHVGGSITGGSIKKVTGIINEKNELETAKKELVKTTNDIKDLELKINDINNLLEEHESKHYTMKLDWSSLGQIIVNKEQLFKEESNKLVLLNSDLKAMHNIVNNVLSDEEEQIMKSYYEAIKTKNEMESKAAFVSKKIYSLKETIDEMENSIKHSNSSFFKKQSLLKDLEIKLNRMDVKLDSLLNILNEEYTITFEKAKKEYVLYLDEREARPKVNELKRIIKDLGMVNIAAIEEYERVSKRYEFLIEQKNDLLKAKNTLLEIIGEMDLIMKEAFEETFKLVKIEFQDVFKRLFGGGSVELRLTDPNNMLETGIEIIALPPGKKLQHISLLSGGEKALTAISLLFAILRVRPVPFCILDEAEAALDEVNVEGFSKFVSSLKDRTQFIVITHKKKTMEFVDVLYGITMQESGVSKLVSVKLDDVKN